MVCGNCYGDRSILGAALFRAIRDANNERRSGAVAFFRADPAVLSRSNPSYPYLFGNAAHLVSLVD